MSEHYCTICGEPVPEDWSEFCSDCLHIPLDNRRENLKILTKSDHRRHHPVDCQKLLEAHLMCPGQRNNTSGFKGVTWHKGNKRWVAQILLDGKNTTLGYFDDPEEAALAYDAAVIAFKGGEGYRNLIG